jgi:PAS domain S-box-containing protein
MGSTEATVFLAMNFPEFQTTDHGSAMLGIQRDPKQLTDFVKSLARNPHRQRRFGFWLCSWLLFLCVPLCGIDRGRRLDQLYHTSWTYTEGAPGEVRALAQTTDGYLWLGTATGLFRFDGIRFQPYKPQSGQAFPQRRVASLFAVPDGGLWVGYWYGGVSFIKNGTVTDYGKPEGLPSHAVLAFARDRQGAIWIAAGKDGLARLEGSRWQKIGTDWGFAGAANTVFVDHAGTVWVGTPTTAEYLVEGGHQFQIAGRGLLRVKNFAESSNGTLWMAETGYGVRRVPLPWKNNGRPGPAVLVGSQAITFDSQGSLWITTLGNGIRRVPYPKRLHQPKPGPSAWQFQNSDVQAFTQRNGLTGDFVYCVLQDREGNVWFGTSSGLDRFRQSPVVSVPLQPISYPDAPPIPSLHSFTTSALVPGYQGAVWAAGIGPQVLLKIQNGKIVTQLRDRYVDCTYRDPNGVVWFATSADIHAAKLHVPWSIFRLADERLNTMGSKRGAVTYKYDDAVPAGQGLMLRRLDLPMAAGITVSPQSHRSPWIEPPRVKAITRDRLGRLWISLVSGTFRLERSGWTSLKSLGGPQGTATAEFTDSEGRIWFGFANSVVMLNGDRIRIYSGKDGVQVGTVTSIKGEGTKIWIGGEFGLEFFDGSRFQPVNPSDGGAFGGVSGIVAGPEDGLWFSANRGIIHIPEAQLRQVGSGKVEFESFGLLDGLTAELRGSLASPSAVQTTDGRIWFATTKGLAWIDPERILRNTVPPTVLIESVIANDRKYNASTFLRLPPRTTNMRIAYTATSLTVPKRVHFRYKLKGQDKEWQDAGTRRQAFYTKLDPGSYQFRVVACNNDGVWNNTGAAVNFSIAPVYYQTPWFRAICLAIFMVLIWMLYRLRVRSIEQRYLERRRAEEERERLREAQRVVVETASDAVVSMGESGAIQFANAATIRVFGYDPKELIGEPLTVLMPEYMRKLHENGFRRYLTTGQRHINWQGTELTCLRKNGQEFPVEVSFGEVTMNGHRVFTGFIRDITERRQAEEGRERLRRVEADLAHVNRVSTMGELTASLAHELNQPITAAIASARACLRWLDRELPDLERASAAAMRIEKDGTRAAEIINRLRSFYKKGTPLQRELVDVNDVVREMLDLLRAEAGRHSVSLQTDLAEVPEVLADRVQLQQVFMNLMLNAIEAMKDTGGELTLKSELGDGGDVLLSVSDTGAGLSAENADQIFNAFFTTKPQGTGMGLAISRSIIESHGGRLWAIANSGRGATFQFTLPTKAEAHA